MGKTVTIEWDEKPVTAVTPLDKYHKFIAWQEQVYPLSAPRTEKSIPLPAPIRSHNAFLNSYAPKDEGLYDDYPSQ
jgi:hypothetical protein